MLTVSDRVSRGEAEDGSGDTLEELLRADGFEVVRRLVPDERDEIAGAIVELARGRGARAHDRRHGPRGARRDARGDALGARARGARDRRGDPGRLDREDAARPALPRRRRARSAARSSSTSPARPGACRDGYAVLAAGASARAEAARRPGNSDRPRPHLSVPAELDGATPLRRTGSSRAWSRSSTRSSRCRSPTSARCSPSTGSRRRTTCSGSRSRWSAPARWRWR